MNNIVNSFDSSEELIDNFTNEIISKLNDGILKKGEATILVSGGSTPKLVFDRLSTANLEWEKINIALVDERWVDKNHEDSNAKLVKDYLLKNNASNGNFVSLYIDGLNASEALEQCSAICEKLLSSCDVLILGMGGDSHTASIFPNKIETHEALNPANENYCISMTPDDAEHTRMSLTLSAILKAQNIYLHFQGKDKKVVYDKAIVEEDFIKCPIAAVLNNKIKEVKVFYNE